MKFNRFTIATLAPLFIGSPLVAQQPSSGQNQAIQAETAQDQSNPERSTERNPAQRDSAQRDSAQRESGQRESGQRDSAQRDSGQPGSAQRDSAQRDSAQRDSAQRSSAGQSSAQDAQSKDRAFAECLAIMNREQVLVARYAQENASSDDVKKFAAMLEKDHQECLGELQQAFSQDGTADSSAGKTSDAQDGQRTASADRDSNAQDRARSASTDRTTNAQDRPRTVTSDPDSQSQERARRASADSDSQAQSGVRRASAESASNEQDGARRASGGNASQGAGNQDSSASFVQLRREVSDQVLKDTHETLSSKDGSEFDKCFVAMQVAKHGQMKSELTVLGRHASGDLSELLEKSLAKNEEHSKAAEKLMRQLTDKDSKESSDSRN